MAMGLNLAAVGGLKSSKLLGPAEEARPMGKSEVLVFDVPGCCCCCCCTCCCCCSCDDGDGGWFPDSLPSVLDASASAVALFVLFFDGRTKNARRLVRLSSVGRAISCMFLLISAMRSASLAVCWSTAAAPPPPLPPLALDLDPRFK